MSRKAKSAGDEILDGCYAKKQIGSESRLLSWSHRRRFETALELGSDLAGKRILDYGCGDGTFLALLMDSEAPPAGALGVDIHPGLIEDCRRRLGRREGLDFALTETLDADRHHGRFDAIFCMEVLEHVVDVESILQRFDRLLHPQGRLIVSVPVETGLPFLVKQVVRRVAGWRGIGDYPGQAPYTWLEATRALLAGKSYHLDRPTHLGSDGRPAHDHKGFNWMALQARLQERFELERRFSSPVRFLPPHLASQAWFILRRRPS